MTHEDQGIDGLQRLEDGRVQRDHLFDLQVLAAKVAQEAREDRWVGCTSWSVLLAPRGWPELHSVKDQDIRLDASRQEYTILRSLLCSSLRAVYVESSECIMQKELG
jgi:hypothetical protein